MPLLQLVLFSDAALPRALQVEPQQILASMADMLKLRNQMHDEETGAQGGWDGGLDFDAASPCPTDKPVDACGQQLHATMTRIRQELANASPAARRQYYGFPLACIDDLLHRGILLRNMLALGSSASYPVGLQAFLSRSLNPIRPPVLLAASPLFASALFSFSQRFMPGIGALSNRASSTFKST